MFQRIADRAIFYFLLTAGLAFSAFLTSRYHLVWDASDSARNTLTAASQQLLERLDAPLKVTVFIPQSHPLRVDIAEVLARYQRLRPDMAIRYVDPDTDPTLARQLGVAASGELRISYREREETVRTVSEEALSNAIQRLVTGGESLLLSLEGHGERSLSASANHDMDAFGEALRDKGYEFHPINLTTHPAIPDNAALLLIASPQVGLLPGEVTLILRHLERGGNLLWLREPGEDAGLGSLASKLGVTLRPGTVVDANGADLGIDDPRFALAARYPQHPVTNEFQLITLFPHAAALDLDPPGEWQATPLITTHSNSWNETGPISGKIAPDQDGERPGPLTLGTAIVRQVEERQQRIVVVGDGDFLSNAYLGNGGNLDLGLNIVRWLATDDALLEIPARVSGDGTLRLSKRAGISIATLALVGLPLLLFGSGFIVWRRRKRR